MRDGYSYLPQFISLGESVALIEYFASLRPLWEHRYSDDDKVRRGAKSRRLSRPVYWLNAWQFACLGYYSEPLHTEHKCVRAEPYPQVFEGILERARSALTRHTNESPAFNSALINYYGSEIEGIRKKDIARLGAHKDSEPGPVVMFSIGQPALFEFVNREKTKVHLAHWARHRSLTILSGETFKDTYYHRVTRVRHGIEPVLSSPLPNFALRRVSVSLRSVPDDKIETFAELPQEAREQVRGYIETLSEHSSFFERALNQAAH